jgi:hypothetical protein
MGLDLIREAVTTNTIGTTIAKGLGIVGGVGTIISIGAVG